ncbi:FAD-binding oxidoreductase [Streptomyces sp. WMMC500]|uniref:FAD-binding oxidoreductase n=1 Tax=Streptomyces sp. WMMC500 TaxID=3015154 RepID=UPI00248BCBFF|nr:FAD-binding oxidoreductase [Streptomyces sp. WMMC500]WBB58802.1 FAD-binding oxidoreductase [Streptomyces sp. WMMC500]
MPAAGAPARAGWRVARLAARDDQTATGRTLRFELPGWPGHRPGQHVDVRLTADDGYQAVRSYSLAAPADGDVIELGVQEAADGEVSPYLADALPVGAEVEIKGPLGGWFVWTPPGPGPLLLFGGGCGVVPLVAMLRARRAAAADPEPCVLLYSVRGPDEVWYAKDLTEPGHPEDIRLLYTRRAPAGHARRPGRVTADDLADLPAPGAAHCYVCGPTGFVEHVADLLQDAGYPRDRIRTERFG